MTTHAREIEAHYRSVWGEPVGRFALAAGPAARLRPGFEILRFRRPRDPAVSAFATCGMSDAADAEGLELHLLVRDGDVERAGVAPIELLTMAAHFHWTGAALGLGHTVAIGRPWLPGATADHALLSLPYLDGPALEWLDAPRTRFLWLLPITRAEREFKREHGLEALEQRFEAARFDYLDPRRRSVC